MKSFLLYSFLLFLVSGSFKEAYAQQYQPVRVSVSARKTVIDGVTYFLHRVQPGETLYAISDAYKVMQKDIVAANPSVLTVVRVGEELKIPAKSTDTQAGDALEADNFIFHIAQRGQTKEDLVSLYGVSLERLYQYNPEVQFLPIDKGQVIKIPKTGTDNQRMEQPDQNYIIHKVAARETLFSIVQQYGVDTNDVLRLNPSVDSRNLRIKTGQELKIPVKPVPIVGIPVSFKSADTFVVQREWPVFSSNVSQNGSGKEFNVALLLPLYLAENRPESVLAADTTLSQDPFTGGLRTPQGNYWIYPPSVNFLNFYEGALMALDSLRYQGVEIHLHIFDTGKNPVVLQQILSRPDMENMDLLIGPFYTEMIEQTMAFAQEHKIFCVSPLTNNLSLLTEHPYLLQVTPDAAVVNDSLVAYILRQQDAFITLATNIGESSARSARWRNQLKSSIPASRMREVVTSAAGFPESILMQGVRNVVVSFSEDEVFVGRMIANINREGQRQNYQVELCGMSSWTRFSNVDQSYLHNLSFVCVSPFFVDYNRSDVLSFLTRHRSYFGMEPVDFFPSGYNYTFLGYDIMWYFGSVLNSCGKEFGSCVSGVPGSLLLTDFRFTRPGEHQGFSNSGIRMIQYTSDYFLRLIR